MQQTFYFNNASAQECFVQAVVSISAKVSDMNTLVDSL